MLFIIELLVLLFQGPTNPNHRYFELVQFFRDQVFGDQIHGLKVGTVGYIVNGVHDPSLAFFLFLLKHVGYVLHVVCL